MKSDHEATIEAARCVRDGTIEAALAIRDSIIRAALENPDGDPGRPAMRAAEITLAWNICAKVVAAADAAFEAALSRHDAVDRAEAD